MRKPSCLGHEEAERFDAASVGGALQQAADRVDGNLDLRVFQAALRQIEFAQHAARIQAAAAGDVGVVGEAPLRIRPVIASPEGCPEKIRLCHRRSIGNNVDATQCFASRNAQTSTAPRGNN
jgi:hypothetical protein